jgi:hypothetical protein
MFGRAQSWSALDTTNCPTAILPRLAPQQPLRADPGSPVLLRCTDMHKNLLIIGGALRIAAEDARRCAVSA